MTLIKTRHPMKAKKFLKHLPLKNAFHQVSLTMVKRYFFVLNLKFCADKSNIAFLNNGSSKSVSIEFVENGTRICNFSLPFKTQRGIENAVWERMFYTYTVRQIPDDAAALTLMTSVPEEFVEYIISVPFQTGKVAELWETKAKLIIFIFSRHILYCWRTVNNLALPA